MKDTEQAETDVINKMPEQCQGIVKIFVRRHDGGLLPISEMRYATWSYLIEVGNLVPDEAEKLTLELIAAMG